MKRDATRHRLRLGVYVTANAAARGTLLRFEKLGHAELGGPGGDRFRQRSERCPDLESRVPESSHKDQQSHHGPETSSALLHTDPRKRLLVTAADAPNHAAQEPEAGRHKGEDHRVERRDRRPEGTMRSLAEGTSEKSLVQAQMRHDRVLVDERLGRWQWKPGGDLEYPDRSLSRSRSALSEWPVNSAPLLEGRADSRRCIAAGESQDGTGVKRQIWSRRDRQTTLLQREGGGPVVYTEFNEDGTRVSPRTAGVKAI